MNKVILCGRLTKDVELSYTQSGQVFARFTIAVDRGLSKEKKQQALNNGQRTADFINCVAWGKNAENASKFLSKGKMVLLDGRIQTGSYTASDGTKRYSTDIMVERLQFIDWGVSPQAQTGQQITQPNNDAFSFVDNEDFPF